MIRRNKEMTPITAYINSQPYPRKTSAAQALGVDLNQLRRWVIAGAYVNEGTVYVPAKKQKNRSTKP